MLEDTEDGNVRVDDEANIEEATPKAKKRKNEGEAREKKKKSNDTIEFSNQF